MKPDGDERADGGLPEDALLEHAFPYGAPLPPHLLINRPFLWLILGEAIAGIAFWSFLATVFADAVFRFDAPASRMALLGASLSVPFMLFIPLQGILVDRWSPKWLNFIGYAVLVTAIPLAAYASSMIWLYASSFLVGLAFAAIEPARSALTGLLIEESKLVRANGMISAAFQGSLVAGTAIGAALLVGGTSHRVYEVAFVVALISLPFQVLVPDVRQGGERPALSLRDLAQGFHTSWHLRELRLLLFVTGIGWMMLSFFWVLEPRFIQQVLHQGEHAVPILWSVHGVGAILGAIFISRLPDGEGREPSLVALGVVLVGAGILLYAGVGTYQVAFAGAAFMGGGIAFIFAPLLALIQRIVGAEQRGRVTSVYAAMQEGMGVGAAVLILVLSPVIVIRPTLVGAGVVALLTGALGIRAAAAPGGPDG